LKGIVSKSLVGRPGLAKTLARLRAGSSQSDPRGQGTRGGRRKTIVGGASPREQGPMKQDDNAEYKLPRKLSPDIERTLFQVAVDDSLTQLEERR
ncbi:unnamed protein product, partial [Amoebophrya sp. A25]